MPTKVVLSVFLLYQTVRIFVGDDSAVLDKAC